MPLSGTRVLDLTRLLPGPHCTLLLADLGADVVKVEDLQGGDQARWTAPPAGEHAAMFHQLNRGKRSLCLDLKRPAGREAFLRLAETADVVVEGFRPGVLARLGVGWETLHPRNPRLVLCSITGYGQDGPFRDRAGHDINYMAVSGALSITGDGCGPAIPGVQVGDLGGGALGAVVAILVALLARQQSGAGQWCDVSMTDGVLSWLGIHLAARLAGGPLPGPGDGDLFGRHPCYALYRCADGTLSVGALEPKFWRALVEALGLPHLGEAGFAEGDAGRRVHAEVEAVLRGATRAQWAERLAGSDVCCEPVLDLDEALQHPQVRARGLLLPAGEHGPLPQVGFPLRLQGTPARPRGRAPGYGEHTREVLAEAGYAAAAIDDLVADGAAR